MRISDWSSDVCSSDLITGSFPDIASAFDVPAVLDGELLVKGDFQGAQAASFNALQQRLNRKTVSAQALRDYPAFVRVYEMLFDDGEALRALPWAERRTRLESFLPQPDPSLFDLSPTRHPPDLTQLETGR